jgi:Family of unknown function (DUF6220)
VRAAHRYLFSLFTLGVVVQFFLAGLGAFHVRDGGTGSSFDHGFGPHRTLGNVLLVLGLLILVTAIAARLSHARLLVSLLMPLLVFLASVLANHGPTWVRAFHPVVAIVVAALAGSFTGRLWRERRAGLS